MIRAGDIAIALAGVALIIALGANVYSESKLHTVHVAHANHVEQFPAWQDRVVRVPGTLGETVIEIRDGRVRVVASPCAQKLCLRAGWLESAGDATACVPNKVSVALLGEDPRFDAINF